MIHLLGMEMRNSHIVIIGNGVVGNTAGLAIRKVSKQTVITIISEEPFSGISTSL